MPVLPGLFILKFKLKENQLLRQAAIRALKQDHCSVINS